MGELALSFLDTILTNITPLKPLCALGGKLPLAPKKINHFGGMCLLLLLEPQQGRKGLYCSSLPGLILSPTQPVAAVCMIFLKNSDSSVGLLQQKQRLV